MNQTHFFASLIYKYIYIFHILIMLVEQEIDITKRQIVSQLDELEGDIALLSKFDGSRDGHRQFAESIRSQQRTTDRLIEQLRMNMELENDDKQEFVAEQENRSKQLQRSFRAALLKYQPNTRNIAQRERELLLSGAATPDELRRRKARAGAGGNAALNAATELTTSLQQTVSMMDQEIEKSISNITGLQESSHRLRKTQDQYVTMENILKTSKRLIHTLEQADIVDRWLIVGGLVLFGLVSFNILRKRVWIPGLSTLFHLIWYMFASVFSTTPSAAVDSVTTSVSVVDSMQVSLVMATTTATATSAAEVAVDTLTSTKDIWETTTTLSDGKSEENEEPKQRPPLEMPELPPNRPRHIYTLPVERPAREEL